MAPFPPSIQRSGSVLGEDQTTNEAPVASTDEREPDRQGGGGGAVVCDLSSELATAPTTQSQIF